MFAKCRRTKSIAGPLGARRRLGMGAESQTRRAEAGGPRDGEGPAGPARCRPGKGQVDKINNTSAELNLESEKKGASRCTEVSHRSV